jgi:hypothetical protein
MLPPGTPLPGGSGVAGRWLYTWTRPPQIAWQGWVPTGTVWEPTEPWMHSVQLQAYYPLVPPEDAGPPPEGGGTYMIVRVMRPGGWLSELW